MNKPRADAVTKLRIRQLAADNPRLQQSEIAKLVNVSQSTVSRVLALSSAPQPLPFSGGSQPPANVPVPNWSNDQPRPPPDRAYDPRYHGHTFQSFSAPQAFDGFDLDRIRNALSLHRLGNFLESSTLSMVLLGYAPVMAALEQRLAPTLSLPRHMKYGTRGLSRVLGERLERQLTPRGGLLPSSQLPSTIFGATTFDRAFMGFSVWQHAFGAPDEETGVRPLYTRRWPTWAVQYYRYRRTYVAITTDGPVDIINDGKFSLIADTDEPHFFGAILSLAEEAFDAICTRRARASYIDRYGNPKWVGIMPEGVAPNSPEGNAMFDALGTIRGPDGYGVLPYGANLDVKSLTAGQSTVMNDAMLSNLQHIASVLLGSDGTMLRGAGVYTSPVFAAVARNIADRDIHCTLRGVNDGHIATDLKYNHAQSIESLRGDWIQPVMDIPLPDPDADARIKSYAERAEKFHKIITDERNAGFAITQERVNQLASSLEIDAPTLASNPPTTTQTGDESPKE